MTQYSLSPFPLLVELQFVYVTHGGPFTSGAPATKEELGLANSAPLASD